MSDSKQSDHSNESEEPKIEIPEPTEPIEVQYEYEIGEPLDSIAPIADAERLR